MAEADTLGSLYSVVVVVVLYMLSSVVDVIQQPVLRRIKSRGRSLSWHGMRTSRDITATSYRIAMS